MLDEWVALDYDIHVLDPGFEVEWERAASEESRRRVRQWYALHLSQALIDSRKARRRARLVQLGLRADAAKVSPRPAW